VIDLAQVESFVARYPSPDDVVPVSELGSTLLNGCFIGACTTAEEDLIIGALVLEAGLKQGFVPVGHGKRKVVPGSLPILNRLKSLGLAAIYEEAGFEIGVPGCSYCVGMGADKAGPGEVWISSQNRNFENRMGTGAIGHISSAATVAASSFDMKITDPQPLLDKISQTRLLELLDYQSPSIPASKLQSRKPVSYVEPSSVGIEAGENNTSPLPRTELDTELDEVKQEGKVNQASSEAHPLAKAILQGKIQRLGDFIDTDAVRFFLSGSYTACSNS
jgi:aconitase A